jgi:SpoIID/LytB domain protein
MTPRVVAVRLALATLVACAALLPAAARPAAAAGPDLVLTGHGFGHGRGLGQWGSLGYALAGSTSAQILDHFYGGTTAGTTASTTMSVLLESASNGPLRVQVGDVGIATVTDAGPVLAPGRAVMLERVGAGSFRISDASSCAGPWTPRPATVSASTVRVLAARGAAPAEFGFASDRPVVGDWNRDGRDTLGVFRASGGGGTFYLRNAVTNGPADAAFDFGFATDVPLVGDWDGDGVDTIGVFRRSAGPGTFFLRNANSNGPPSVTFELGFGSDTPIVGDWDGDGRDSVGLVRAGGGSSTFFLRNALSNGPVDAAFPFGFASDVPVVGDWDGVGADGIAVRRGSDFLLRNALSNGPVDAMVTFGATDATPFAGDWEGDGRDTVGVRRAAAFELHGLSLELLGGSDNPLGSTLQLCAGNGDRTWYRGELRAVDDGALRAVNVLDLEAYLRGVVPRESPASWGTLGCEVSPCRGLQALMAQSVAARSYSVAENRRSYAKTCDTISCQVYGGRQRTSANGVVTVLEQPQTDQAVAATAGLVRIRGGAVVRTEFSSSTGGFTAGGEFPAVIDQGDGVAGNTNHDWTTTITAATLEAVYGRTGFQRLEILARSTLDGGRRVTSARIVFDSGAVTRTGEDVRRDLGLRSTWFDVDGGQRPDHVGVARTGGGVVQDFLRYSHSNGPADAAFTYGIAGDRALAGDWDGNGLGTIGMFRPDGGAGSFLLRNTNDAGGPNVSFQFGFSTDLPVVGDWDGDGDDTPGVFRPEEGRFYLRNSNSGGPPDVVLDFGLAGDRPVAGDWDADGRDSVGVFRPGNATFYLRNATTSGVPDATFAFGFSSDLPVVGDWDGSGTVTVGVFRSGTFLLRNSNSNGPVDLQYGFGLAGDVPIAGSW